MNTFKVGDVVTLRGQNRKLAVMSVSGIPGCELILQELSGIAAGCTQSRCLNGRFNDWQEGPEDIVPIPPEPLKWNEKWGEAASCAAMDLDGTWYLFSKTPKTAISKWVSDGMCLEIPPDLAQQFTGDWRKSLIERPQP